MRNLRKILAGTLAFLLAVLSSSAVTLANADGTAQRVAVYGDVNDTKTVNTTDALIVLRAAVGKVTLTDSQQLAADVDLSNTVNSTDALLILRKAVGKLEMFPAEEQLPAEEMIYVDPVGLTAGNLYNIDYSTCLTNSAFGDFDLTRLAVCIQGLVNRNFDKHHVAINVNLDPTDPQWLSYMMQEGRTYNGMKIINIKTTDEFLNTFDAFLKQYGIIAWDPAVPSTSNVASTICGLQSCVPVQYSETSGSLYQILLARGIPVKQSLVGLFENAALGGKIADTALDSSGSAKCDAYLWALDKYFAQTNLTLLAYTPDGIYSVPSNPLFSKNSMETGIPNHDYFISKQCFFFDLTSYSGEAPNDDPTQPLGTDANTLKKILQTRYDLAYSNYGVIVGFPPWHLKYTTFVGDYDLEPPRLEWHFVETVTSYNCGIEADAAHPCWMSNGSLYTNYKRVATPKGNAPAKDVEYDSNTRYYTLAFTGDFDCSPWLKARARIIWNDSKLGTIPMTFNFNLNLVDRVPMIYDYIFERQTDNDYLIAAEGFAYSFPSALSQGFVGKEASPTTRTLPTGKQAFYNLASTYYQSMKIDTVSRVINGATVLQAKDMDVLAKLAPRGVFLQASAAGSHLFQMYNNTPFMKIQDMSGESVEDRLRWLYATQTAARKETNFTPISFFNVNTNYATASGMSEFVDEYKQYIAGKVTDSKYEYLDINTFLSLAAKSGQGVQAN